MTSEARYREQRWTSADGLAVRWRSYDAGPAATLTVLCLPELTRNSRDLEALAPPRAERYRLECPGLRRLAIIGTSRGACLPR